MNVDIPQRQFSKEEINRCYLRWQQLRNEHGENARNVPEFIYFTKVLHVAAKQQQELQQQRQAGGGSPAEGLAPGESPLGQEGPLGQQPGPAVQQTAVQQQQQQQGSPAETQSPNGNPGMSIFTIEQSELLKAQITSLKCLVNKQPVPAQCQGVIQRSITNPPDFKRMLLALSDFVKRRKQGQEEPQPAGPAPVQARSESPGVLPMQRQPSNNSQLSSGVPSGPTPQSVEPQRQPETKVGTPLQAATQPAEVEQQRPSSSNDDSQEPPFEGEKEPPRPEAPVPLEEYRNSHPEIEKIIDVENPDVMVDCFTLPNIPEEMVDYNNLFPKADCPRPVIQPGVLPVGIDIHTATEIYQTLIALNLDTAVDDCLTNILDDRCDENEKEDALYDYYAFQLLPLQKAARGHLLQFVWYQNSLLTNTHPNFLSKIRNVNIQDTLLTGELYKKHEIMQYEKKRYEKSTKLEKILDSSVHRHNKRLDHRTRRVKFGHKLINTHSMLEKEEQRRAERKAKERLQALKANDEEAYIKLLDQTKDTRITHLLKQTNAFLDSLTRAVKDQQDYTKEMIDSHVKEDSADADELRVKDEGTNFVEEADERSNVDYYNVAHRITEEIREQPAMLVGGTLKDYQLKGLQWMVSLFNNHLNGILADEMGLGKTIQTISLLAYLYEKKDIHGPFLIIVPLSTLTNWSSEFAKWAPTLRTISYKGSPNERKSKQAYIKSGEFDVVVTTFEYVIKEKAVLSKVKWVHMIIDEGHRMKNAQSKLSLTLNNFYHSDYRLILTGTPLQNNLPELWALLNFALPKIFNSVKSFDEWFNTPFSSAGGQEKIELSEEEMLLVIRRLHKVLRPFLLRRLKKDVEKELPDKVEKVIKCKMSALQQIMYQQMLTHRRLFVGDRGNKKMVGLRGFNNQIMQLKKICNHPFVFEAVEDQINPTRETNANIWRVAGKFELLERVLPKLKATGHRCLIFFQMTQIMDIMEDFLRYINIKYLRLDGHTKSDERSMLLKEFNDPNSEYFCFILSTRAGGLGLNLQTADTVIIFDTDWNPHQDLQAQDRAHRIGQKNEVRILRLITENSVEEVILERAHKKLDIDGKVIQAGKFDNKSTSEEQEALLRSLLDAEDERRRRRELGMDEEEEIDDNEINDILARDESEIPIFAQVDAERSRKALELNITTRLMENNELPEIYSQDIARELELEREESENANAAGGRGARERKSTHYGDSLSEEQWLKQFEVSDNEDDGGDDFDGKRRRNGGTRGPVKKLKTEDTTDQIYTADPSPQPSEDIPEEQSGVDDQNDDKNMENGFSGNDVDEKLENLSHQTAGKTSVKSARTSTKGKGRVKARGKTRVGAQAHPTAARARVPGRVRGRPAKAKTGLDYVRDIAATTQPYEIREVVSKEARELYDYAVEYTDEGGRSLSDIFSVKPSKKFYPDYYQLIKYPIAFDNISNSIDSFAYDSLKEVLEDFHLIFSNARIYNTEDSIVYADSVELEEAVTAKYREMAKDDEPIDFTEFEEAFATRPLNLAGLLPTDDGVSSIATASPGESEINSIEPSGQGATPESFTANDSHSPSTQL